MSYKHREPVSVKTMLSTKHDGHHSLCQTLRDIYVRTTNEQTKLDCRVAMAMGKAMHDKLKKYKKIFEVDKPQKGLVYYTDNHGDEFLLETCRKQILRCMEYFQYPIVSVSQKPLDFGTNFVMDLERSVLSIFKQILKGLEESNADIIFLLEHDMIYHPSHFDFTPPDDNTFYYDRNRWSVCDETGRAVFYHTDVPSMLCARKELLIEHYSKCVENTERDGWTGRHGYSPPKGLPGGQRRGKHATYFSEYPTLDIRRKESWARKRMDRSEFKSDRSCVGWKESGTVPGWGMIVGRFNEFLQEVNKFGSKE